LDGHHDQGSEKWYVFEVRDPSPEATLMAREWLEGQTNLDLSIEDLQELLLADRPTATEEDLEGCPRALVFTDRFEVDDELELTGAEQLGVLEDVGAPYGPYNVVLNLVT
jgi:hypothetical protein